RDPGSKPDSNEDLPCMGTVASYPVAIARKLGEWLQLRCRPGHLTTVQNILKKVLLCF
ncbi:hypothetical protein AVEN_271738-1, partial [Araneus ventricosus]